MKKRILAVLVLLLTVSLCACGLFEEKLTKSEITENLQAAGYTVRSISEAKNITAYFQESVLPSDFPRPTSILIAKHDVQEPMRIFIYESTEDAEAAKDAVNTLIASTKDALRQELSAERVDGVLDGYFSHMKTLHNVLYFSKSENAASVIENA